MHAVDDDELASFDARIRDRLADLGRPHGLAAAEVFHLHDRPLNAGREGGRPAGLPPRRVR